MEEKRGHVASFRLEGYKKSFLLIGQGHNYCYLCSRKKYIEEDCGYIKNNFRAVSLEKNYHPFTFTCLHYNHIKQ